MKWVDYREKLGIGFSNEQKFHMFKNIITVYLNKFYAHELFNNDDLNKYLLCVGEDKGYNYSPVEGVIDSINETQTTVELISKMIAFCNTYSPHQKLYQYPAEIIKSKDIYNFIRESLIALNISFEVIKDNDGYFIFPKGAKELDDALVSQPLEWLKGYPLAHRAFVKALKDYSSATKDNASEVADSLRKALETFFQGFFKGTKSLENYKSEYGDYLKSHGVPAELANDFIKLLGAFTDYNNNYAKHHDKASLNVLEYLLYQTGNIIRLLITLKNGERT